MTPEADALRVYSYPPHYARSRVRVEQHGSTTHHEIVSSSPRVHRLDEAIPDGESVIVLDTVGPGYSTQVVPRGQVADLVREIVSRPAHEPMRYATTTRKGRR